MGGLCQGSAGLALGCLVLYFSDNQSSHHTLALAVTELSKKLTSGDHFACKRISKEELRNISKVQYTAIKSMYILFALTVVVH